MRLTDMNRFAFRSLALAAVVSIAALPAVAQNSAPPGKGNTFRDTSMVKPPPGAKVAIYEFEDLECPACAHAFPIIHEAVEHYHIPLVRHDFPLKMHIWSFDAAITARYLQDKVSPKVAEQFRGDVFANQTAIASKDDLENYTRKWFQTHGLNMPFVMDPAGLFRAEVEADYTLGERIGLSQTPTIFVVTNKGWTQIMDPSYTYQTIDAALAETGGAKTSARASLKK
jgi:protein-disulfide isomerase